MPDTAIVQAEPVTRITGSLTVTPVSERVARLAAADPGTWSGEDLLFYIKEESGRLTGPQLPCFNEQSIVRDFLERFGMQAVTIARLAFEIHGGMWMGAPVTVRRFSASNDEFFARPLIAAL